MSINLGPTSAGSESTKWGAEKYVMNEFDPIKQDKQKYNSVRLKR